MGGFDAARVAAADAESVDKEIHPACQRVPRERLILSPGCSVPDDLPELALTQIKEAVQKQAVL